MKRIIAILTVGRSGSSALARGLKVLGVDMGAATMEHSVPINAKGLWEDNDIMFLGHEILSALNTEQWKLDGLGRIKCARIPENLRSKAIRLLEDRISDKKIFGFKDVLAWKVIPFWKDIFSLLNVNVTYVIAVRNPVEVASSFNQFQKFFGRKNDLVRIYLLWLESALTIMKETSGLSRVVVDYDQLLIDPRRQIFRMARVLGIENSEINENELERYEKKFIEVGLRNHFSSLDGAKSCVPLMAGFLSSCYGVLQRLARDELGVHDPEVDRFFFKCYLEMENLSPQFESLNDFLDGVDSVKSSFENTVLKMVSIR